MDIACRQATDPPAWDAFVRGVTQPNEFLQSWTWGEFQRSAGKAIIRLEVVRGETVVAACLLVPHTTRLGKSFLLSPRGPAIDPSLSDSERREVWSRLLSEISRMRPASTMFLKVEPNVAPPEGLGLVKGTAIHPEQTLLLDLKKSDDELLKAMRQKTRYNIHLAERKGVRVEWSRSPDDVERFFSLLQQTAKRQGIGIFPRSYYATMVKELRENIEVAVVWFENTVISAALLTRFGDTMTYVHGASSNEYREAMAPHLLHWKSVQRARDLGCTVYDFFGVSTGEDARSDWVGMTRFKLGFGGTVHAYPGAFNLIFERGWYYAYHFAKRIAGR